MIKQRSQRLAELEYIKDNKSSYIEFYSNKYSNEDDLDIEALNIIGRVPVATKSINETTFNLNIGFTIPPEEVICPSSPIEAINPAKTEITLEDATLFDAGMIITIDEIAPLEIEITAKTGDVITVTPALPTADLITKTVKVLIKIIAVIAGGTSEEGTGEIYASGPYNRFKNATTPEILGTIVHDY